MTQTPATGLIACAVLRRCLYPRLTAGVIPAYYLKQNPNINIVRMGYTDVYGYTTAESAPPAILPEMNRQAISKKQQNMINTSVTF